MLSLLGNDNGNDCENRLMSIIYHSSFDESGKFKDKDVIGFCGYISSPEIGAAISDSWFGLLRKHSIPYLHVTKLMSWKGPYVELRARWGDKGRPEVLTEFASDLHRFVAAGILSPIAVALGISELETICRFSVTQRFLRSKQRSSRRWKL